MTHARQSERIAGIARLCAAQRQVARAGNLTAQAALDRAETARRSEVDHRDTALDVWSGVVANPLVGPELVAHAGRLLVDRERTLGEAERVSQDARHRLDGAARILAEASARNDVAATLRANADRTRAKHRDELHAAEAEDRLLHRRPR